MARRHEPRRPGSRSWDPVAEWYIGWVGSRGSEHHRAVAIPAVLDLLAPMAGRKILDIGCGTAALAGPVTEAGGSYTGVDASRRLVSYARRHQAGRGRFLVGDAAGLHRLPAMEGGGFDAAVFLLSIQDIDPLEPAIRQAAWALREGGRLVILMTHPCFRVPRQSGWGWDGKRRLQYRRVDRYLTPLMVPMKAYMDGRGSTRSHHRPLQDYMTAMSASGLLVDAIREIPTHVVPQAGPRARAELRAGQEFPLFMALRAVKS